MTACYTTAWDTIAAVKGLAVLNAYGNQQI